jgi:tRNA (guanine-N7-)-methyltransferase
METRTQSNAQQQPPAEDLRHWFVALDELEPPLEWSEVFGNSNPVEVDVGCGRGLFLVTASEANPGVNFLGVEVDFREGRRGARRLKKREQPNARAIGGDVKILFSKYVPERSLDAVHVYFPDPWWKRRHRRRRVFNDEFVDLVAERVLKRGGLVHSWTDVEEYFGVIRALMDHDARFEPVPPPPEKSPEHDMDYRTSYERKKRKAGLPIYRGCWRLCD